MTEGSASAWFKGNLHTHSLWSDGDDYPEMIIDFYRRNGYHFLALSDHNVLSQGERWIPVPGRPDGLTPYRERFGVDWVQTRTVEGQREVRLKPLGEFRTLFEEAGRFLLIQGEEITDNFASAPIHLIASNLAERLDPRGGDSVARTIANNLAAAKAQSERLGITMLVHAAHPNFHYAITAEDLAAVTEERFFEIYNGHPEVNLTGDDRHVSVESMWDIMNTLRIAELASPPLYGLAVDDSHHYSGGAASPGRGWVMVRARFLSPEHLINAMMAGDFYASTGIMLDDLSYSAHDRTLTLHIAAEPDTDYTTQFIGTPATYDVTSDLVLGANGRPATRRYSQDVGAVLSTIEGPKATYRLNGDELYVRAVVTSSRPPANPSYPGQLAQAWTQPVGWETATSNRALESPTSR